MESRTYSSVSHCLRRPNSIQRSRGVELSKLDNKGLRIMSRNSLFVDLTNVSLKLSITLENEYSDKLVVTKIIDTVKDMIVLELLTELKAWFCYQYIRGYKVMLMHESILPVLESMNSSNNGPKRLGIFGLGYISFCVAIRNELPTPFREKTDFVTKLGRTALFHGFILSTSTKRSFRWINTKIINHSTNCCWECLDFLTAKSYVHTWRIFFYRKCLLATNFYKAMTKMAGTAWMAW